MAGVVPEARPRASHRDARAARPRVRSCIRLSVMLSVMNPPGRRSYRPRWGGHRSGGPT